MIKIANAQGFWGDRNGAAAQILQQVPDLHYITLDYLAEVSLSILAIQREKDPHLGYAVDFLDVVRSLIPFWKKGSLVKIVCNAGGLNPLACAESCQEILQEAGLRKRVGVLSGDDVLQQLKENPDAAHFNNLDTGEPLSSILDRVVTANAYLGAKGIAELLKQGADIVITGRVADPSLTVGPCIAEFNWLIDDYARIAQATVAGHLIECGTQVTGGISTDWLNIANPAVIGFPIVEMEADGTFTLTKPEQSSGRVDVWTVKEQLLYELGDPDRYLSPDATVSFTSLHLEEVGQNRMRIRGAQGSAPPRTYKVSATYRAGFRSEAYLTIFGEHAAEKAQRSGEVVLAHLAELRSTPEYARIECLGTGQVVSGKIHTYPLVESVLRIAVRDPDRKIVEAFTHEIAPLVTSGPQGVGGYLSGRPSVRPVFGYWPCLIENISAQIQLLT